MPVSLISMELEIISNICNRLQNVAGAIGPRDSLAEGGRVLFGLRIGDGVELASCRSALLYNTSGSPLGADSSELASDILFAHAEE